MTKIIITSFQATNEGVVLETNVPAKLKSLRTSNTKCWVSWDHIGRALFENYTDESDIEELRKLRGKPTNQTEPETESQESLWTEMMGVYSESNYKYALERFKIQRRTTPPTNQTKCERCKGTGLVGKTIHTENGDFDADDQPCPECKPLKP